MRHPRKQRNGRAGRWLKSLLTGLNKLLQLGDFSRGDEYRD